MGENNLIQRGDLQQRLTRGLEIKERAPAPTLAPDVQAVVLLEDLVRQGEFLSPKDRAAASGQTIPGVAGNLAGIILRNPVGSQGVIVVDRVTVSTGVAAVIGVGIGPGGPAPAGYVLQPTFPVFLDNRNTGRPAAELYIGSNVASQLNDIYSFMRIGTANAFELWPATGRPIILAPNNWLIVEHQTVASSLNVDLAWREIVEP